MDYKSTLLLPKTEFEMRGNLNKKEPRFQEKWETMDLYAQMQLKREGHEQFVLHDGPPYANGNIHLGHALNKILKDFLVRSKFMAGYKTPFRPGWDTHGLPIENAIQKLGVDRKSMPIAEFRALCEKYALEQVEIQKADFKSLGTVADYKNPYITLSKDFVSKQIKVFSDMAMKGMIYKGMRPVYWSPSSESALAEAEIEYRERRDPAIFVSFNVEDGKGLLNKDDAFLIWTTTPWTIPANLAISLHPDMDYVLVKTERGNLVMGKTLIGDVLETIEVKEHTILKEFKGSDLENITVKHPLYDRTSRVLNGDHVTDDAGTGCVHTAPDHGVEDFEVAKKYGIEPFGPVNEQGILNEVTGEFAGLTFEEANKAVTMKLDELGHMHKMSWLVHSYPHDWRTKKPIIFRATTQWFASIDSVREQVLAEIEKVEWQPAWGQKRMHNMIADRGDWCISRQRAWGVPIPIFYCEDGNPIMEQEVFDHIVTVFATEGPNVWFEKEAKDLLPEGYVNAHSPNGIFTKEKDIMDVWFDSGSSHTAALDHKETPLPADVYAEGSDQYRGWFNSSLIISTAVYGISPYKKVVSHGFIMHDDGEKMSKSKGNALSPQAITSTLGADTLRLWVASVDYHSDISMSEKLLKQISESYRKIRNTFRFMLGNLNGFSAQEHGVAVEDLSLLNRYVLNEIIDVNKQVQAAYAQFDYQKVTTTVLNSMTNLMSSYYLDYNKDTLYIEAEDDKKRREVQTVLYHAVDIYSRLMAPILVHTMEELTEQFSPETESIHLETFSPMKDAILTEQENELFKELFEFRDAVFKALEDKRAEKVIGKSLEAHVTLNVANDFKETLETVFGQDLAQWLIVSKVSFTADQLEEVQGYNIAVEKIEGSVCPRCWNIVETVNEDGLCERCASVLTK
ncbi:isoleucine--tRNA ligase [Erysipelothrix urinaevulpis]|uniref:isoleucine--tRNA ligase n=1 Tax=Erysipelothrix urinaevulpis TaxID=2683717 RepID=UPI00135A3978|nr:isoleucine--tRNA ligase [Erysipelothrix urinaevulpis]